jgi:hypothetical protein
MFLIRPTVTSQSPIWSCWLSGCKCGLSPSALTPSANSCRTTRSNYWISWAVAVPALWYEQIPYPQLTMWEVLHLFTWLSNLHSFVLAGKLGKFDVARWWTLVQSARKFLHQLSWKITIKSEHMTVKLELLQVDYKLHRASRDSAVGVATWTVRGSNPGGARFFAPVQTGSGA